MADRSELTVNGDRLLARLDTLARISDGGPGVTRLAYGELDVAARQLVAGWMADAGLGVAVDEATNLIGRRAGTASCGRTLATGSHLDTVVHAGPLDGAYGVVAAVEAAAALSAGGALDHGLTVIAFANEEGARGTAGLSGSRAIGRPETVNLEARDDEEVRLADRLLGSGGDPERIDRAAWGKGSFVAFVELHVEQGPVLDRSGRTVGVVEAITGQLQFEIEVVGQANHAGTTPMAGRRDALVAAAEFVLAVEQLAGEDGARVATVGRLVSEPNVRNVVPGHVHLAVDLRDADAGRLGTAAEELRRQAQRIGTARGVTLTVGCLQDVAPTQCHPAVRAAVVAAAEGAGLAWEPMVSGASHDTQSMAPLGPVGMIFVPSTGGVSHAPGESTTPADLIAGANTLLASLQHLDHGPLCVHDDPLGP